MNNREYKEDFKTWKDVLENYGGECPKKEPRFVFAEYSTGNYEGDSTVIVSNDGKNFQIVSSFHCSCYGLEGQWEPTKHKEPDIKKMMKAEWGFFVHNRLPLTKWLKHIADIVQQ